MYKAFVEFSLTVGCVNQCVYCPQEAHLKAYTGERMLSMDDYVTMINKLPKSTISIAGFSEPFVNPECTNMIEYAGKQGHHVIVYTTLQGMTIEDYQRMRKMYFIKSLVIHLPDKEGNMKTKITEEYKALLKFIVSQPPGAWCRFDFSVHGSAVHPDIAHIININPVYRIHDRAGALQTDDKSVHKVHWESGKIQCGNGFGHLESGIIMPNADTYLCCMCFNLKSEHKLGNLMNQSWGELMNSEPRRLAKISRDTGIDGICRHCAEAQFSYGR
jgi:hypothetical protein